MLDKAVIITQRTRLDDLLARFNTREQARFWIEHMGLDFADYDREHAAYRRAVDSVETAVSSLFQRVQRVDRGLLPNFLFAPNDVVIAIGRDGLVVNTAKYVDGHPILGVNPDPERWDGVLLPFSPSSVRQGVVALAEQRATTKKVTMAEVLLNDGQRLLAFNDFLVGRKDQLSARYTLSFNRQREVHSSSGVLISTGAGSTGWLSSAQNMAEAVAGLLLDERAPSLPRLQMSWDDPRLVFVVREPYRSRATGASLAAGLITPGSALRLESLMPEGGAIFSDGMVDDALPFNSGMVATIRAAEKHTLLVTAGKG